MIDKLSPLKYGCDFGVIRFTNDDGTSRGTYTGMYVNGLEHGRWVSRDADGRIELIWEYDNGREVERIEP